MQDSYFPHSTDLLAGNHFTVIQMLVILGDQPQDTGCAIL